MLLFCIVLVQNLQNSKYLNLNIVPRTSLVVTAHKAGLLLLLEVLLNFRIIFLLDQAWSVSCVSPIKPVSLTKTLLDPGGQFSWLKLRNIVASSSWASPPLGHLLLHRTTITTLFITTNMALLADQLRPHSDHLHDIAGVELG